MEALGGILSLIGMVAMAAGGIWLLVVTFKKSVGWGLASLFLGVPALVFVFMNWAISKRPFLTSLAGFACVIAGGVLGAMGASA